MADTRPNYSTPSSVRSVTSYPARRGFKQGPVDPSLDYVIGVEDAIDIHCHAHEGQQDALGVAKLASKSGMMGILYKTIVGRKDPAGTVAGVRSRVGILVRGERFHSGASLARQLGDPGFSLEDRAGVVGQESKSRRRRPVDAQQHLGQHAQHRRRQAQRVGQDADPNAHTEPLSWDDSLKYGHYLLDDKGRLLPEIEEIFRMAHDHNAAIFFGHPTKPEFRAMAEFSHKIGFKKGVVDHPFSPFVSLTIEEMKEAGAAGLWLNFHLRRIVAAARHRSRQHVQGHSHGRSRALHALVGRRRAAVSQFGRIAPPTARPHDGVWLHGRRDLHHVHGESGVHRRTEALDDASGRARHTSGSRTAMRPMPGHVHSVPRLGLIGALIEKLVRYPVATRNTKYRQPDNCDGPSSRSALLPDIDMKKENRVKRMKRIN